MIAGQQPILRSTNLPQETWERDQVTFPPQSFCLHLIGHNTSQKGWSLILFYYFALKMRWEFFRAFHNQLWEARNQIEKLKQNPLQEDDGVGVKGWRLSQLAGPDPLLMVFPGKLTLMVNLPTKSRTAMLLSNRRGAGLDPTSRSQNHRRPHSQEDRGCVANCCCHQPMTDDGLWLLLMCRDGVFSQ